MLLKGFLFACIFFSSILISIAQSNREHGLSRQLNFSTDNDFFVLTDRYYTFGMDIEFNSLVNPNSKLHSRISHGSDSAKVRLNYHYGNKIFTPDDIDTRQTKNMDRPYAGWNFVRAGMTIYNKSHVGHDVGIETGVVGKISGMGQFQQWWHELINIYSVYGWDSQIANEVVVNLNYSYTRNWKITKYIDLTSISKIILGTGSNKLGQEVNFRFLKFNPINNSAFTNSHLSWNRRAKPYNANQEAYFFAGVGGEYVASTIFIEGSLFKSNRSVYTVDAKRWLGTNRIGFTYSRQVLTYSVVWYHISKEVRNAYRDKYLSLNMSVRF